MEKLEVNSIKVHVALKSGKTFFGYLYLSEGQRLQDLMNDERKFVPINKHMNERSTKEEVYKLVLANKDSVDYIEER